MAVIGIDIIQQRPTDLSLYLSTVVRFLIIVCHNADQSCPRIFPGMMHRLLWPFDDPAHLVRSPEETLNEFRRIREEIRVKTTEWLAEQPIPQS